MNYVFRVGATLAVAAHMVLGCCLHHAHGHNGSIDQDTAVARTHCSCDHECGAPASESDHPSPRVPCDGDKCVFTRLDSTGSPDLSTKNVATTPVCTAVSVSSLNRCETVGSRSVRPTFHIPLHLLNQVLLI